MKSSSACSVVICRDDGLTPHRVIVVNGENQKQKQKHAHTTCVSFNTTLNTTKLSMFQVALRMIVLRCHNSQMSARGKISVAACTYVRARGGFCASAKES